MSYFSLLYKCLNFLRCHLSTIGLWKSYSGNTYLCIHVNWRVLLSLSFLCFRSSDNVLKSVIYLELGFQKGEEKIWFHFYICSNPVFREHLCKHYLFSILFLLLFCFLFGVSDKHQVIPVDCTYVWILNYIPLKYVSVNASTTLFYN